jgi:Uma2 family endonuclease
VPDLLYISSERLKNIPFADEAYFYPNLPPQTKKNNEVISDEILPNLNLTPQAIFKQAGLDN